MTAEWLAILGLFFGAWSHQIVHVYKEKADDLFGSFMGAITSGQTMPRRPGLRYLLLSLVMAAISLGCLIGAVVVWLA